MIQNIIENLIYKFYPKDIEAFDLNYENSIEYSSLLKEILFHQKNPDQRNILLNNIRRICSDKVYRTDDLTQLNYLDRCFTFVVKHLSDEGHHSYCELIICISILGPFYCIYTKCINERWDVNKSFIGYDDYEDFDVTVNFPQALIDNIRNSLGESMEVKQDKLKLHLDRFNFYGVSRENFTIFNGLFKNRY